MQKARRKLIKGALAATAVTVAGCGGSGSGGGSGGVGGGASAFSVPSSTRGVMSWHTCVEKSAREAEAIELQPLTAIDDTFLRMEVQIADGLLVDGKLIEGRYFLVGQTYHEVVNVLGATSPATQWTVMTAQPRATSPGWAAVQIGENGQPTQIALLGPAGFGVASDSCWNSVMNHPANIG